MAAPATAPVIAKIGPEGAELIAVLMASSVEPAWPAEAVRDLLVSPGCAALIATEAAGPVGFALLRGVAGEAELLSIGVLEPARRRGVGRALVGAAAAAAAESGAAVLHLEVAEDNQAARGLYQALGFRPVGRRPGYYAPVAGRRRDALLLALALPPA